MWLRGFGYPVILYESDNDFPPAGVIHFLSRLRNDTRKHVFPLFGTVVRGSEAGRVDHLHCEELAIDLSFIVCSTK